MTAAFFPESLFGMGVDTIATTVVDDGEKMMDALVNCGPMVERFFSSAGRELLIEKEK